jgi:hypothetical protein
MVIWVVKFPREGYKNSTKYMSITLFESENEWQKTEQAPILLPRASRNFPDVKTRNKKKSLIGLRR